MSTQRATRVSAPGRLHVVRVQRDSLPQAMAPETRDQIELELCQHFEAMQDLMHRLGHGPVRGLELRMTNRAWDCEVTYRWDGDHA